MSDRISLFIYFSVSITNYILYSLFLYSTLSFSYGKFVNIDQNLISITLFFLTFKTKLLVINIHIILDYPE